MGAACCKSSAVVQPESDNETPRAVLHGDLRSSSTISTATPNVFKVLNIASLSATGEVTKSPNKGGSGSDPSSPTQSQDQSNLLLLGETAVKVVVLVRPLIGNEVSDVVQVGPLPGRVSLPAKPNGTGVADAASNTYNFAFDAAFRVDSAQASRNVFQLVMPVVEKLCQGFNGAVLAYGQTGSGKTYTMGTAQSMSDALKAPGQSTSAAVIPTLITALWGYINAAKQQYNITVKVQYVEIYNESLQDLLSGYQPKVSGPAVHIAGNAARPDIRENAAGEVIVDGVTTVTLSSPTELAEAVDFGASYRAVASHKMNEQSSRSHAILMLTMEQRAHPSARAQLPTELHFLRSRLHLVDLAGSERVRDTGAQGARFAEGVNINKGLLELGNVINALAEGTRRRHVPYRNSKLTRVLQDSLGGSAETLMLACVSPAASNHDQTLNTLRYAQRARAIRNKLQLNNQQSLEEEVVYLRDLVARLQQQNASLQEQLRKQSNGAGQVR